MEVMDDQDDASEDADEDLNDEEMANEQQV